jgi:hypothetical protein
MHGRATFHAAGAPDDLFGTAHLFRLIDQLAIRLPVLAPFGHGPMSELSPLLGVKLKWDFAAVRGDFDPEETSPGRGTSRGEIRDPLLSDADRFYRGGSPFSRRVRRSPSGGPSTSSGPCAILKRSGLPLRAGGDFKRFAKERYTRRGLGPRQPPFASPGSWACVSCGNSKARAWGRKH